MKKTLLLLALPFFLMGNLQAQCQSCSPVPGELIEFCYSDPALPKVCAQFVADSTYYFLDRGNGKPALKLALPQPSPKVGLEYLNSLLSNKKNKLTAQEVLFLEDAIESWNQLEAISHWNKEILCSGFTVTPSGLAYKLLIPGTGARPAKGKTVRVHYTGYFEDGKKFDSSYDAKRPFEFKLGAGQVIKGWDEGVALFPIGSRFLLRLPSDLAYGSKGVGPIPPNAVLYFDVSILSAD